MVAVMPPPDVPGVRFHTSELTALPSEERAELRRVFHAAYADASDEFLDAALGRLLRVAYATDQDGWISFALGGSATAVIPEVGPVPVMVAGLMCTDPERRRRGLAYWLSFTAMAGAPMPEGTERFLVAGRAAHAGSLRMIRMNDSALPVAGRPPTRRQQAAATAVAAALGVERLDPGTFRCEGDGASAGTPRVAVDVPAGERAQFAAVDRRRGDTILGLCWMPAAPPGWLDPDPAVQPSPA